MDSERATPARAGTATPKPRSGTRKIVRWIVAGVLLILLAFLLVMGRQHALIVRGVRAAVSQAAADLAAEAREYSTADSAQPATMNDLARERPAAADALARLRDNLGSDIEVSFAPPGASRATWTFIAVSRRGVVLFEVTRAGDIRMYEPRLPSRAMGCHCLSQ